MEAPVSVLWVCPLCREPLHPEGGSLQCPARHSFDVAREGYVNLLPSHRKRSREPGDSRDMIDARRRVHGADVYRPLVDAIIAALAPHVAPGDAVLDLGCGEGYYTQGIMAEIADARFYGVDIAKPAVRMAAKACTQASFAVASAYDLPLPENCMSAVFNVFAPVSVPELQRVLRPGGLYLKVTPGARHLWALRQLLYDEPRPHVEAQPTPPGFTLENSRSLPFKLDLHGELLRDLVAMTPYAYGGQRENKARLEALTNLPVEADFVLSNYRCDD